MKNIQKTTKALLEMRKNNEKKAKNKWNIDIKWEEKKGAKCIEHKIEENLTSCMRQLIRLNNITHLWYANRRHAPIINIS